MNRTNTFKKRVKITGTGKQFCRPRGLGHSRANKTSRQKMRKNGLRKLYAKG